MARYGRAQLEELGQAVGKLPELTGARPALLALSGPGGPGGLLAGASAELVEDLARLGLAALAAGWFGCLGAEPEAQADVLELIDPAVQ
jgi:hypothetical protein